MQLLVSGEKLNRNFFEIQFAAYLISIALSAVGLTGGRRFMCAVLFHFFFFAWSPYHVGGVPLAVAITRIASEKSGFRVGFVLSLVAQEFVIYDANFFFTPLNRYRDAVINVEIRR